MQFAPDCSSPINLQCLTPSLLSPLLTSHLLNGCQAMQLGIAELLLEHELVEILSCIGLPLQGLQSLEDRTQNKSNHS